jgi:thymidylate synthase
MLTLAADSASVLFQRAVTAVAADGRPVAPRGLPTVEVLGASLLLTDPRRRLVDLPPARVLNPAFAAAETVWILAGSDSPWIFQFNDRLAQFADGGVLRGAYGPRLRRWQGRIDQLDRVRRLLLSDRSSRQAVVQLFDPARDCAGYRDVPCTVGYRFFLRDGRLHMYTTMRSQDLWLGFPYDLFAATVMQELLAGWVGAEVGDYVHEVDSLHLYVKDVEQARSAAAVVALPGAVMPRLAVEWARIDRVLGRLMSGVTVEEPGWRDVSLVLRSYGLWKAGCRDDARRLIADAAGVLPAALGRWYDRLDRRSAGMAGVGVVRG